jgi:hypothetical protein
MILEISMFMQFVFCELDGLDLNCVDLTAARFDFWRWCLTILLVLSRRPAAPVPKASKEPTKSSAPSPKVKSPQPCKFDENLMKNGKTVQIGPKKAKLNVFS